MFRYFSTLLFFSFAAAIASAQYKPVPNTATFKTQFTAASAKTTDISADFKQEKTLTLLSEKLISKGIFYFKKENLVRMEYTSPYQYVMIINGSKVTVKDGQKTNTMSSSSNKIFQQLNQLMMDCMRGTVFENKDFSVRLFEDTDTYLAEMIPVTSQMSSLFKKVNVVIKKNSFVVSQVQMFEPSGDNTLISYFNQKINTSLPDALFTVK
jgi:outer membrane lipoprotein-sorting protein